MKNLLIPLVLMGLGVSTYSTPLIFISKNKGSNGYDNFTWVAGVYIRGKNHEYTAFPVAEADFVNPSTHPDLEPNDFENTYNHARFEISTGVFGRDV